MNCLEGRALGCFWAGARYAPARRTTHATREHWQRLEQGGYLIFREGMKPRLTEAGRAVAERYREIVKGQRDGGK